MRKLSRATSYPTTETFDKLEMYMGNTCAGECSNQPRTIQLQAGLRRSCCALTLLCLLPTTVDILCKLFLWFLRRKGFAMYIDTRIFHLSLGGILLATGEDDIGSIEGPR